MHIYIHVPFCARRCSYCDFSIAVRRVTPSNEFVKAIGAEWRMRKGSIPEGQLINTLYFGGGTPSRLAPEALAQIIGTITTDQQLADDAEVTIEVNPDDVTPEHARSWVAAGVNRVSLGVQSHNPTVLVWMHRTHRIEQVPGAIATLRDAGIANISVDLIFGLPAALDRDWQRDLDLTFVLLPEHISLYGLTVEPHTPLSRWTARGETVPVTDDRYAEEYLAAHHALEEHGFEHYEVSNAGLPGRWSQHNSSYWAGSEYLGLGPSAHSYLAGVRSWNMPAWAEYAVQLGGVRSPQAGAESLDEAALLLERRYLGLRTVAGLPIDEIPAAVRSQWMGEGWAFVENGRFKLTVDGWLRLDALVASLGDS